MGNPCPQFGHLTSVAIIIIERLHLTKRKNQR
jgi:hypothetical protein